MNFNELDLRELDKNLSEDEQREWNAIYASYRAGSSLKARVVGMDSIKYGGVSVNCLVVVAYRIKILIPESEIWFDEKESRPPHVSRSMTGAIVEYVITNIDREGECATASRRKALVIARNLFKRNRFQPNEIVSARILSVGKSKLLAEAWGYDSTLTQRDLSYGMLVDLRQDYRPGQEYNAVIKSFDSKEDSLVISIKEAEPHPFDGADIRHRVGSRRASRITGKYGGGVFCRLDKNLDCLCVYSPYQRDEDFNIDDEVIVVITKYDYDSKMVFGKIVAKW